MSTLFSKTQYVLLIIAVFFTSTAGFSKFDNGHAIINKSNYEESSLYDQLQLSQLGLKKDIFDNALKGWNVLLENKTLENPNLLSIADLSQSSNSKRLYVIDLVQKKVLFNTYVAHGNKSGEEFASSFANTLNSHKSSLGFYITGSIYNGIHGLAMRLRGIEKGINDIAEERGIVMHGAPYVSESFIKKVGRLGRSQGCPAVPAALCTPIVNSIKEGSCFFIFYPDSDYFKKSQLL
jgi:hypothetical protein